MMMGGLELWFSFIRRLRALHTCTNHVYQEAKARRSQCIITQSRSIIKSSMYPDAVEQAICGCDSWSGWWAVCNYIQSLQTRSLGGYLIACSCMLGTEDDNSALSKEGHISASNISIQVLGVVQLLLCILLLFSFL